MKPIKYINFPRSYFNTSESCHAFPEASEMFVCYAKPLPFTYLEFTLQHPRHKIRKAPSRPNFSYLSDNFSSCVTCYVMVNITMIQQKPQNFKERQKRWDRFLCGVMVSDVNHYGFIFAYRSTSADASIFVYLLYRNQ